MFAILGMIAALFVAAPKTVAHVEILDTSTCLVIYSDCSAAIGQFEAFRADGTVKDGFWFTTIEAPAGRDLWTKWTDVSGLQHEVRTGCATLTPVDCAIQHQKDVEAMLKIFPAPKSSHTQNTGGGDGGVINLPSVR